MSFYSMQIVMLNLPRLAKFKRCRHYSIYLLSGFTLIELLVVVAVIAILAAIAVPNFLEAQVRSKVSRSAADMRSIATAIESYAIDYTGYPADGNGEPYRGLVALTTPVSYISSISIDPFNTGYIDGFAATRTEPDEDINKSRYYELGTGNLWPDRDWPRTVWALAGYGPDIDDDTDTIGSFPLTRRAVPYDPTNGTLSDGDLYRFGPLANHPNFITDQNPLTP